MRVVVDNSKGGEVKFARDLQQTLAAAGFDVELREPVPASMLDTAVHFVVEGVSVRVPDGLDRDGLKSVAAAVREAEGRRRPERRRVRAVPIYRGETTRVLAWVDVFDGV